MRTYIRVVFVFLLVISLCACGKKSETVFLEKDGELYEIADRVSFFYPKSFTMNTSSQTKEIIEFVNNQEMLTYSMIVDNSDNKVEDMPALYAGQLEQDGAIEVSFKKITIDSGLVCQEFTGVFQATGLKFKNLVYFTNDASYVLSYQAPDKVYDENIVIMTQYLTSLIVS